MSVLIAVGNGKFTEIDDLDWELSFYNWSLDSYGYVQGRFNKKLTLLHNVIVFKIGLYKQITDTVDHIDRDKLNNKKSNLRIVTRSINCLNRPERVNNTGIRGVSFDRSKNKYVAYLNIKRKRIHLGFFDMVIQAANARKEAEIKYLGEQLI